MNRFTLSVLLLIAKIKTDFFSSILIITYVNQTDVCSESPISSKCFRNLSLEKIEERLPIQSAGKSVDDWVHKN